MSVTHKSLPPSLPPSLLQVFFVVNLQPPAAVVSSPTSDPDPPIQCDLMDGRDAFLTMARERHWEFSSRRRARNSTMCMTYELHNQSGDRFTCNHCRNHVETRYHCKDCEVSAVIDNITGYMRLYMYYPYEYILTDN